MHLLREPWYNVALSIPWYILPWCLGPFTMVQYNMMPWAFYHGALFQGALGLLPWLHFTTVDFTVVYYSPNVVILHDFVRM